MKLTFSLNFSGGQLLAEVDSFAEADKVIDYALKRGVITMQVETPDGDIATAEVTAKENLEAAPEETPEVTEAATAEEARLAVKAYAAKHGLEKGRALLGKFGLQRTAEITDELASAIVEACNE